MLHPIWWPELIKPVGELPYIIYEPMQLCGDGLYSLRNCKLPKKKSLQVLSPRTSVMAISSHVQLEPLNWRSQPSYQHLHFLLRCPSCAWSLRPHPRPSNVIARVMHSWVAGHCLLNTALVRYFRSLNDELHDKICIASLLVVTNLSWVNVLYASNFWSAIGT